MVNQRLNAEIREAKEHFETIFNTSPDASLITRLNDGLIVDINDGFTALTGFTRKEAIGKSSLAVNIWKNPVDRQKVINELSEKGFCENLEAQFQRKDGSQLSGSMSAKMITLPGTPHIISVTHDITERQGERGGDREECRDVSRYNESFLTKSIGKRLAAPPRLTPPRPISSIWRKTARKRRRCSVP